MSTFPASSDLRSDFVFDVHVPQSPGPWGWANYWASLMRKRHTMPHSAQSQHTNYWAPRTRKRHQQEHRPQRPTESSDPTQHAKGRTGDRPGPRKGATTRRNVTQGGGVLFTTRHHCTGGGGSHTTAPPPPGPTTHHPSSKLGPNCRLGLWPIINFLLHLRRQLV